LVLDGTNGPAKLRSAGTMSLTAGTVKVAAGAFEASIDPVTLNLSATGDIVLTGGAANNARAVIAGNNVTVTATNIMLTGGTGNNSFATIAGTGGNATVSAGNEIIMSPGSGTNADASILAPSGILTINAVRCIGCVTLGADPSSDQGINQGLFGSTVVLNLPPSAAAAIQIDNSIIYASSLATSGGTANTSYSNDAEEKDDKDKEKEKSPDVKQDSTTNGKPKRNLPMCI
jgi:hypothetical protein